MSSTSERFNPPDSRMGDPVFEEEVRKEAYLLWEQAGRPEGRDIEFWFLAIRARIEAEPRKDTPGIEAAGRALNVSGRERATRRRR